MNAVLRLLALLGLAPFSFALVLFITTPPTTGYDVSPVSLAALTSLAPLGFAAVIAAGIGATSVSLERRQRGWVATLLGALALNAIWELVFTLLAPFIATLFDAPLKREYAQLLFDYSPEVVLALVVLAYTVIRQPDVAGAPRLLAVNGAVRALSIAGSTGLVLVALSLPIFTGGPRDGLQLSPFVQDLLIGGGAVFAVAGACLLVVDCLQRRRRGRAIALIVVLLLPLVWRLVVLLAYAYIPPLYSILNTLMLGVRPVFYLSLIFAYIPFLPVAVLALVLSFLPRAVPPAAAAPALVAENTGSM